jgi:GAF domain-containing protein
VSTSLESTQVLRFSDLTPTAAEDLGQRLEQLNAIGASLSAERDIDRLLEAILTAAKTITRADGGSLYRVTDDRKSLRFEIVRTSSLKYYLGGTTGNPVPFYPVQLYKDGKPNHNNVSAYVALTGKTVNIPDAYTADGFDFSGTRGFDSKTGYRSKSFLTVPMRNHERETIGVLQLINAQDPVSGEVVPFSPSDQRLAESLASQAAVALTNRMLINQLEQLFESFINLINTAIDEKSPYTGGHCPRSPCCSPRRSTRRARAPWPIST